MKNKVYTITTIVFGVCMMVSGIIKIVSAF